MGESRRSRRRLAVAAALGYGLVFAALCLLHVSQLALAAYFMIPTALVAITGGPVAGGGGAVLSLLLGLASTHVNPQPGGLAAWPTTGGRAIALLCTGVLLGWFAARNRALVSELRLSAERDHLTGLGNHRFYEEALERRLRAGAAFVLLVCDMDRLKDVNDGHGHSAGDDALRRLAVNLRTLARADDEIARIGGDEFCVVATVGGDAEAGAMAARVEAALASAGCPATFGWATHPADGASRDELFRAADARLYARKASRTRPLRSVSAAG
jgi:diguanylate cyclase (GGDEF)-like protein